MGEMAQWGHCSFCRRLQLSERQVPNSADQ